MKYMDDMKKLGQRIRERRQELNLSQPQLAECAGHITPIERGEIVPTLLTVQTSTGNSAFSSAECV